MTQRELLRTSLTVNVPTATQARPPHGHQASFTMMMLLRKRRVTRGICVVLACYTLFLLALAWTAGDGDVTDQPEFFSVLKLRQLGRDLQQKAKGVSGVRFGASPALGRALQHQPGKMPSRRQLSKPDVQQINVIVEDPLPGTFVKQAADPGSEGLQDLVSEDKKPPLRSAPIADPRALDRILAGSPVDDSRTLRTEKSKFLSKDSPRLRDQKMEKENDSGFKDFDPKAQEAEEKETNLGEWISPDGAVDNQRETETDVLGSSKDAQRTHSRAQDAEQFHTERPADPRMHANSEQQTGGVLQRNRPAHPQTQRSSEHQTGGTLQKNRPAHPQTQRSSEHQTGGALQRNRPAHPQTQSSEQQTGGALQRNRPAPLQTQRSSNPQPQHGKKEGSVDPPKPTNIRHHQTALNKTHKPVHPPTIHTSPPPSPPKTLAPSSPGFSVSRRAANFVEISDLLVYSAFYDGRLRVPVVRILGVGPAIRRPPVAQLWCVFSTASAEPSPLSVRPTADCKRRKKYCCYMLLCQVPERAQKNNSSLANLILVAGDRKDHVLTSRSGERVRLQVIHNSRNPPRHVDDATSASGSAAAAVAAATTASGHRSPTFAVCVPPLFGKIPVLQIVEFIEMNRLLGASHLVFYTFSVSREVSRLLAFYEEAGVVSVMPWNIPAPNDVWNKGESAAMGDCLYRSMHVMDYVIFSDMNEYLVPKREASWQAFVTKTVHSEPEMMKAAVFEVVSVKMYPNSTLTQSSSRTSVTKSEVSKFLTVRNTLRAEAPDSNWTKLVVKPERVLELDPEFPPLPISRTFVSRKVDSGMAAMFHYTSKDCVAGVVQGSPTGLMVPKCGELREDHSVWKLKDLLLARTKQVVRTLNQQVEVRRT